MTDVNGDVYLDLDLYASDQTGAVSGDEVSDGGGGGGVTLTYKKRARDSNGAAPPPPASYVYWDASNPGDAYPLPPPFGGPLVEDTVLEIIES